MSSDPRTRGVGRPVAKTGGLSAGPGAVLQPRSTLGVLCLMLLAAQLLPPLPAYFGLVQSMALGTVLAASLCILLIAVRWAISARRFRAGFLDIGAGSFLLIVAALVAVVLHGIIADQFSGVDFARFSAALIPLVLTLGGALALAAAVRSASAEQILAASWVSFTVLCAIILLKVAGLQPRGSVLPKSTFPFTETSHFALAFGPILLYRCTTAAPRRRDLWLAFAVALAIVVKSGTLLAVALMAAVIGRRVLLALIGVAVVAALGLSVQLKYFTSRIDLSNKSSNLSALVYLEGWEMLQDSLERSSGWGVGFEQLGLSGTNVTAAESIRRVTGGEDFNLTDGSFVLSKLGSEFGVVGLLMVLGYCLLAVRSLRLLRAGMGSANENLARCIVLGYAVDMFVRGTGYFTQSTMLFLAAAFVLAPRGGLLSIGRAADVERAVVLR